MAAEAEAAAKTPPPSAGGRKQLLLLVGVALVALSLGGGGVWFFARSPAEAGGDPANATDATAASGDHAGAAAQEGEGGDEHADPGRAEGEAPLSERLITLEPFVVNLDESGARRFLKTRIELETASPAAKAELQTRSAQMRDAIIVLLASKRLEDLGGFEGKVILKNEIGQRLNDLLGEGEIRSVLITEFVIQ